MEQEHRADGSGELGMNKQSREECWKESNNCGKCYRGITETWREENIDC